MGCLWLFKVLGDNLFTSYPKYFDTFGAILKTSL